MRTLLTLVRKDIANFLRNRSAVALTFFIPVALIYIFGWVFGLNRKDTGPTGIRLAVVNASSNPGAEKLVAALKAEPSFRVVSTTRAAEGAPARPLAEDDARRMIRDRELRFALVIPEDLVPASGFGLHLKILSDPRNEIETQMVNGLLQRTIFTQVPQLLGQSLQAQGRRFIGERNIERFNDALASNIASSFGGDAAEIKRQIEAGDFGLTAALNGSGAGAAGGTASGSPLQRIVRLETEQVVGKHVQSPEATRVVGGWAIMFLLFAVSGSSAAFFDEKNAGLFQRLLSAPITRGQLLWARFLFGVLLGLVQLVALFAAGRLMYGIDVVSHFGGLVVVCTLAAAACTSFGMLVAAAAPNAQAAQGLATFVVMVMSATGGAWYPMSLMPEFMQTVGKFTVVYWSMEGFSQVLWAGQSLGQMLPTLGVLAGISVGVMGLAIWLINRKRIFD